MQPVTMMNVPVYPQQYYMNNPIPVAPPVPQLIYTGQQQMPVTQYQQPVLPNYPQYYNNTPMGLYETQDLYTLNDVYYEKKDFTTLFNKTGKQNLIPIYEQIKNNNDFNELINSKFYSKANGFFTLLNTMDSLQKQRITKNQPTPNGWLIGYMCPPTDYAKYDIPDYLKMLNNFIKSDKISDDLKKYYLKKNADNLDIYYYTLNQIDKVQNPADYLL